MTTPQRRYGWVLNLDADLELACWPAAYTPTSRLLSQLREHGAGAAALLGPSDVLVQSAGCAASRPDPPQARELLGRAWCPTPRAIAALRGAGIEPEPHPAPDVLRRVNHRRFAFELGGGLPGQRYVESAEALDAVLEQACGPTMLKRPLSFAGRGQERVLGPLSEKQRRWIAASLAADGLLAEPLVTPTLEVSVHGFLLQDGSCELGRVCVQNVGPRGTFLAVRPARDDELEDFERRALLEQAERVAQALAGAGYFGPFGIDGYRYEHDGGTCFCPLGEINARYTMGFAAGFAAPHRP